MASIKQLKAAAEEAGFVTAACVHENPEHHLVLDYPVALTEKTGTGVFWRVHTDLAKVPHMTYIIGEDTESQRVSLKNAIDFMQRVAKQNPK